MKKIFGQINMGWKRIILSAVIIGIYTGLIMVVPFLKETSFQDIGISYEWWVIFAVIIVVNCQKPVEAALKCFVFFLISQPIIYLVQLPFGKLTFEMAKMYYTKMWLPLTFATLPGGFIAWFCKKQNIWGSIVLGLGNTIEIVMGAAYISKAVASGGRHILSALVSLVSIIVMTLYIQKGKRERIIAMALPVLLLIVILIAVKMLGLVLI